MAEPEVPVAPDVPLSLAPIGVVRSPFTRNDEIAPWGGPAELHIAPAFVPGLIGIERSSHLFVIGFLHEADRTALHAKSRGMLGEVSPLGVFCCRSPARPNPLSLTVTRLVERRDNVLCVDPLDLLDGTPIVDLKPYNPGWDDVFAARRLRRVPPDALSDAQLVHCLERNLLGYLGALAQEPEARVALAAVLVATRHFGVDSRDEGMAVATNVAGLTTDALIALCGASFASGRIRVTLDGAGAAVMSLRFEFTHAQQRLVLTTTSATAAVVRGPPEGWVEHAFARVT